MKQKNFRSDDRDEEVEIKSLWIQMFLIFLLSVFFNVFFSPFELEMIKF